jgi:hypothetical protein
MIEAARVEPEISDVFGRQDRLRGDVHSMENTMKSKVLAGVLMTVWGL